MATNCGIAQCATAGVLTHGSIMAVGPSFSHLCTQISLPQNFNVGFHVTLNSEWDQVRWGPVLPASMVPSLVEPDGTFTRSPRILSERGVCVHEAIAEVEAQLDCVRRAGFRPVYLDEHMSCGWIRIGDTRTLREELAAFARREGLIPAELCALRPLPPPDASTFDLVDHWLSFLKHSLDGDYLLVSHPTLDDPGLWLLSHTGLAVGQVARERRAEAAALCDPRLRVGLDSLHIDLITYLDL